MKTPRSRRVLDAERLSDSEATRADNGFRVLLRRGGGVADNSGKRTGRGKATARIRSTYESFRGTAQRCTVKARYAQNSGSGSWGRHGNYLQRVGSGGENARAEGFDGKADDILVSARLRQWEGAQDERLYKLVISPEHGERIDLKRHVREVMKATERRLGREVEWCAAIHRDTDNPHAHVCLRSKDSSGKPLGDISSLIKSGLREISSQMLTRDLGYRSQKEVLEARAKAVHVRGLSELDRILLLRSKDSRGQLSAGNTAFSESTAALLRQRLQFLESNGFCRTKGSRFTLSEDFEKSLRNWGRLESLRKGKLRYWNEIERLSRGEVERKVLSVGEKITGRVLAVRVSDDFHGREFMLLETTEGKVVQINAPARTDVLKIRENEIIQLEKKETRRSGRHQSSKIGSYVKVNRFNHWRNSRDIIDAVFSPSTLPATTRGFAHEWHARVSQLKRASDNIKDCSSEKLRAEVRGGRKEFDLSEVSSDLLGIVVSEAEDGKVVRSAVGGKDYFIGRSKVKGIEAWELGDVVIVSRFSPRELEFAESDAKLVDFVSTRNGCSKEDLVSYALASLELDSATVSRRVRALSYLDVLESKGSQLKLSDTREVQALSETREERERLSGYSSLIADRIVALNEERGGDWEFLGRLARHVEGSSRHARATSLATQLYKNKERDCCSAPSFAAAVIARWESLGIGSNEYSHRNFIHQLDSTAAMVKTRRGKEVIAAPKKLLARNERILGQVEGTTLARGDADRGEARYWLFVSLARGGRVLVNSDSRVRAGTFIEMQGSVLGQARVREEKEWRLHPDMTREAHSALQLSETFRIARGEREALKAVGQERVSVVLSRFTEAGTVKTGRKLARGEVFTGRAIICEDSRTVVVDSRGSWVSVPNTAFGANKAEWGKTYEVCRLKKNECLIELKQVQRGKLAEVSRQAAVTGVALGVLRREGMERFRGRKVISQRSGSELPDYAAAPVVARVRRALKEKARENDQERVREMSRSKREENN